MFLRRYPNRLSLLLSACLILSLTNSRSEVLCPVAVAQGITQTAQPTHPAEVHKRVGVAALVLPNVRWNKQQALSRIESYVRRAAALGAKIVVTPETCIDGYVCHQEGLTREKMCTLAEPEDGAGIGRLREVAQPCATFRRS